MKTQTISILGLRRTGLSIAMAIKATDHEFTIIGYDSDSRLAHEAEKKHQVIDKSSRNLVKAVAEADIVVITVPATELQTTLDVIGTDLQEHTLVIDMAPMKAKGAAWAESYFREGHYIGARPVFSAATFADGGDDAGAARADLFKDSLLCVMAPAKAEPKAVETAVKFGILLGAQPYFLDAAEYDSLVQGVESLPALSAAAMFKALHGAAGWRDMLRFADLAFYSSTSPLTDYDDISVQLLNDPAATLRWLDAFSAEIATLRRWVQEGDQEALSTLLSSVNDDRERWLFERLKNDWVEGRETKLDTISMSQQLFGGLARRGKKGQD